MQKGILKPKSKNRKITFTLEADDAKEVYLVGEFNNWKVGTHPMKNNGVGKWKKQLLLPEGKFEYKFLVDNQWVTDPKNERVCTYCFGTLNSVVRVAVY